MAPWCGFTMVAVPASCCKGNQIFGPGVVCLSTCAWSAPQEPGEIGSLDKRGDSNVLTLDKGSSKRKHVRRPEPATSIRAAPIYNLVWRHL